MTTITEERAHQQQMGFRELADRLGDLMQNSLRMQHDRDQARLKIGRLRGALIMAEAELEAFEDRVARDKELSEPYGAFLLRMLEDHPARESWALTEDAAPELARASAPHAEVAAVGNDADTGAA